MHGFRHIYSVSLPELVAACTKEPFYPKFFKIVYIFLALLLEMTNINVQPVIWSERVKAVQPSQYPRGSESSCNRKMCRVKMRCGFCFSFGVVATMSHCATQAEML